MRKKKELTAKLIRFDKELADWLDEYSEQTGASQTRIVNDSVRALRAIKEAQNGSHA